MSQTQPKVIKMKKLTIQSLKNIIREEAAKFSAPEEVEGIEKDTKEVDADGFADTLEKPVDMLKALKIEESRLNRRLAKIAEQKKVCVKKIMESK